MMVVVIGIERKGKDCRKFWPQIHRIQCCVTKGIGAAERKGSAVIRKWGL